MNFVGYSGCGQSDRQVSGAAGDVERAPRAWDLSEQGAQIAPDFGADPSVVVDEEAIVVVRRFAVVHDCVQSFGIHARQYMNRPFVRARRA